jgi:hypothetical protein
MIRQRVHAGLKRAVAQGKHATLTGNLQHSFARAQLSLDALFERSINPRPTELHAPLACAVAVIRWGADVSSDRLRQRARCSSCGKKGATIQHPGWGGNDVGFLPFPVS